MEEDTAVATEGEIAAVVAVTGEEEEVATDRTHCSRKPVHMYIMWHDYMYRYLQYLHNI